MRKNIALFPNHPAQIWFLLPIARNLEKQANVIWFLRDKDVSLDLADSLGLDYRTVSIAKTGLTANGIELFINIFKCVYYTLRYNINLWVTKYGCGNIAAWLCRRESVSFNDDDADIVPLIAKTSYPFAKFVMVPEAIRMKGYENKAFRYRSVHELAYLHPENFTFDPHRLQALGLDDRSRFCLIRLSALKAHHDLGVRGISQKTLRKVIDICKQEQIRVFISSEKALSEEFQAYAVQGKVDIIHHLLAKAEFLLSDSQSMSSEACVLGTFSIQVSDFKGKLSVIELLSSYGLSKSFVSEEQDKVVDEVIKCLQGRYKEAIAVARQKLLEDLINPVPTLSGKLVEALD